MKYNARTRGARGECHTPVLYNGPSWNRSSFDYFFIFPPSFDPISLRAIDLFQTKRRKKVKSSLKKKKTYHASSLFPFAKFANQTVEEKIVSRCVQFPRSKSGNPDLFRGEQSRDEKLNERDFQRLDRYRRV